MGWDASRSGGLRTSEKIKKTAQIVNEIILCYVYKGITSFENVAKRSKRSQVREVERGAGALVGGEKT